MNKYIFLQPSICGMGGAQQYLHKKVHLLEELGWNVTIVSAEKGDIMIDALQKYADSCIEGLRYSICYYNRRDIKRMVDEAIELIAPKENETIYIESATASMALWGELIAQKLHCRHVCFDFEEVFTNLTSTQLKFVDFKHQRKELAGISIKSIPLMFKGYKEVKKEEAYFYKAMCSNPVEDEDSEWVDNLVEKLKEYQCVIGTIGRAEKPYLLPTLKKIREYTQEHQDVNFAVILIGGNQNPKYENEAKAVFNNEKNVTFFSTGMIYPIPRKLVRSVDVFASSSGSAHASAQEDIPTIAISPCTFGANGILNYTTKFSVIPDKEVNEDIKKLLYAVLDEKYCQTHEPLGIYGTTPYDERVRTEYKIQIDFVTNCEAPLEYYDVLKVKKEGKLWWVTMFTRLIGRKAFMTCLKLLGKSNLTFIKG